MADQGQFFKRADADSEFLLDFSHHSLLAAFPFIDFSSGELPQIRHETSGGPFLDKDATVPNDDPD
jgi:hypothetical protein